MDGKDEVKISDINLGDAQAVDAALNALAESVSGDTFEKSEEVKNEGEGKKIGSEGQAAEPVDADEGEDEEKGLQEVDAKPEGEKPEGVEGEEKAEGKKDDLPDEPSDHAERSRLGRRLVGLESTLQAIQSQLAMIAAGAMRPAQAAQPEEAEEDDYEIPQTKAELAQFVAKTIADRQNKERAKISAYQNEYTNKFLKLSADLS
jgi:hypothetical protein